MELRTKCKKVNATRKKILGIFGDSGATGLIFCVDECALVDV